METLTVEQARQRLSDLLEGINKNNARYRIADANGNAILISEETYENLVVTLEMLSTPLFLNEPRDSNL